MNNYTIINDSTTINKWYLAIDLLELVITW